MLTAKTTALIAAMAVMGTVAPAAFAQDFTDATDSFNAENEVGDISVYQSQSNYASQYSESGDYSTTIQNIDQDNEQGFCINLAQAAATTGSDAESSAFQAADDDIDCS